VNETNQKTVGLFAALGVIIAWLALLFWLVTKANDSTPEEWTRLLALSASIEAVALGAAGALFGTTIQSKRVEDAKQRANMAEGRATEVGKTATLNLQQAANGRTLAIAIKARAPDLSQGPGSRSEAGISAPDDLVTLARKLFPD
jgi:hypothetical protein